MNDSPIHILLVDDDAFVREFLADVLRDNGFEVQTAENGLDALDKFVADPELGLIISDINMPRMDGLQLLRELRTLNFDVPVVMVTGVRDISVAVEALQGGAADYVIKDESIQDTITLTVRKALERRQLKEQNLQLIADLAVKTEQLESAISQLTAIINTMPDGLLVVNAEGRITLSNPALCEMFGLREAPAAGSECGSACGEQLARLMEEGRRDGETFHVSDIPLAANRTGRIEVVPVVRKQAARDAGEERTGVLALVRDITAEKELDRMKDDFIATVSHELRTPLTSILGFVKIISKRLEAVIFPRVVADDQKTARAIGQVRGNIGIIEAEGERLTALINDILDLAKMEAGKMEWELAPCSVGEIIDRAASVATSLSEQKGIPLVRDVEEALPPVTGDGDRLLQVVLNLLSNAVKFTDAGSVACSARMGDGEIVVQVRDTGSGIPPEDLPTIFEKFKQAGGALTDKPKGTGLGLPISRHIVERHGGRIWAESELGKGSSFFVALPVVGALAGNAES